MVHEPRSRRAFLAACAAGAAGLAGCQSFDGTSNPGTPTDPGGATPASEPTPPANDLSTGVDQQTAAPDLQGSYRSAYEATIDSVASVRIYDGNGGGAQGTAFVYDVAHLVTNEHVVSDADAMYVRFQGGGWQRVRPVGSDVYSDLAAVRIPDRPETASPLPFVDEEPPIGTRVVAIGNPFGLAGSVSSGIISGTNRTQDAANGFSIPDTVQTDAPVNPGNSGGPLVTLDGNVVGVVNAGGGDNIGFAISAALIQRVIPSLIETGDYQHSYMGVRLTDVTPAIAQANGLSRASGIYIDEVVSGSPSDGVLQGSTGSRTIEGVQTPTGGDVVRRLDDTPVPTRQDLSTFLALQTSPGDTIDVTLTRDGSRRVVPLTLGTRPEPP